MIRLLLLAALVIVGGGADIPWDRIEGLTLEEAVVVLGTGHGFNVTRDGIVTLDDGERIDISALYIVVSGPIEISLEHAPHKNDESPPQSSASCSRS